MKAYLITYEIKEDASKDYTSMFEEIKRSKKWWHYIANSWIIMTEENSNKILERLKPYLNDDVNMLIVELGKDRQGWLSEKAWNWIKINMPRN